MVFIRTTLLSLIIVTFGVVALSYFDQDRSKEVDQALAALLIGNTNESTAQIEQLKGKIDDAQYYLLKSYLCRKTGDSIEANSYLHRAEEASQKNLNCPFRDEIILNQLYNKIIVQEIDGVQQYTNMMHATAPNSSWLPICDGYLLIQKGQWESATTILNQHKLFEYPSSWAKDAFTAALNENWKMSLITHCCLAQSQPKKAIALIEQAMKQASTDEQENLNFLMGVTYLQKACSQTNTSSMTSLTRLALSYLKQVAHKPVYPIKESSITFQPVTDTINQLIKQQQYSELHEMIFILERWQEFDQLTMMGELLINSTVAMQTENKSIEAEALSRLLIRLTAHEEVRQELTKTYNTLLKRQLTQDDAIHFTLYAKLGHLFNEHNDNEPNELIDLSMKRAIDLIQDPKKELNVLHDYLHFCYQQTKQEKSKHQLTEKLLTAVKNSSSNDTDSDRGYQAWAIVQQTLKHETSLQPLLDKTIAQLYQKASEQNRHDLLTSLHQAARERNLDALLTLSQDKYREKCQEIRSQIREYEWEKAEEGIRWLLTHRENDSEARQLLALIAYQQGKYEQANTLFSTVDVTAEYEEYALLSNYFLTKDEETFKKIIPLIQERNFSADSRIRLALASGERFPDVALDLVETLKDSHSSRIISAIIAQQNKLYQEALSFLEEIPDLEDYSELCALRAECLLALDQPKEAEKWRELAHQRGSYQPKFPVALPIQQYLEEKTAETLA